VAASVTTIVLVNTCVMTAGSIAACSTGTTNPRSLTTSAAAAAAAAAATLSIFLCGADQAHRACQDHVVVTFVEMRAPSREQVVDFHFKAHAKQCLRNGIQVKQCPGLGHRYATHRGRRLLAELINSELGVPLFKQHQHQTHGGAPFPSEEPTNVAQGGNATIETESEEDRLRAQLVRVTAERDVLAARLRKCQDGPSAEGMQ
jgi:hypothetical protein